MNFLVLFLPVLYKAAPTCFVLYVCACSYFHGNELFVVEHENRFRYGEEKYGARTTYTVP